MCVTPFASRCPMSCSPTKVRRVCFSSGAPLTPHPREPLVLHTDALSGGLAGVAAASVCRFIGADAPKPGSVGLEGTGVADIHVYQRRVTRVFQSWPHLWRVAHAIVAASPTVLQTAPAFATALCAAFASLVPQWQCFTSPRPVVDIVHDQPDAPEAGASGFPAQAAPYNQVAVLRRLRDATSEALALVQANGLVPTPLCDVGCLLDVVPPRDVAALVAEVAMALARTVANSRARGSTNARSNGPEQQSTSAACASGQEPDARWRSVVRGVVFANIERAGHMWPRFC